VPKLSALVSPRETAISQRLRDIRISAGWSQSDLAKALGTTRDQLASIEYGRNPLRYWLADRFCEKLNVCQSWLAIGEPPIMGYVGLPAEVGLEIGLRDLFSAVFDRRIGHLIKREIDRSESLVRSLAEAAGAGELLLENYLYNLALCWFGKIPPHLYSDYFGELSAVSSAFFQKHKIGITQGVPPSLEPEKKSKNSVLTQASIATNLPDVKSQLDNLLGDLNRLAAAPGKKTELALFLGAPLASVSRWLAGEREPGGETTLRMLKWVGIQGRLQKSPGDALTPPEHKTQVRKSCHEKQTQVRSKR